MRKSLVIVGAILLVLGAVLMFVPIFPSTLTLPASDPSSSGGSIGYNVYESSFSLVGGTSGTFAFSATSAVTVEVISCSNAVSTSQLASATTAAQFNSICGTNETFGTSTLNGLSFSTGTSGSFHISIPSGGTLIWFAIASTSPTPSVTTTTTLTSPLFGLVLLALGALLLVVGLVLKKKVKHPAGAPPMAPAQPWTPPGPPATGPGPAPGPGPYAPGAPPSPPYA